MPDFKLRIARKGIGEEEVTVRTFEGVGYGRFSDGTAVIMNIDNPASCRIAEEESLRAIRPKLAEHIFG